MPLSVSLTSSAFAIEAAQSAFNRVLLKFMYSKVLLFLITSPKNFPASASNPLNETSHFFNLTFSFLIIKKFFFYIMIKKFIIKSKIYALYHIQ